MQTCILVHLASNPHCFEISGKSAVGFDAANFLSRCPWENSPAWAVHSVTAAPRVILLFNIFFATKHLVFCSSC